MFTTIRVISKHQDTQIYDAILPQHLTNQAMLDSKAYKTYHAYATGEKISKTKYVKNKAYPESSPKKKSAQASKGKRIKTSTKVAKPVKKKQPTTTSKDKGLNVISEVALSKAEQIKLATKRSLIQTHSSHASGSGADEGTDVIPGVPDVPTYNSDDEQISWKSSDEDDDDEVNVSEDDDNQNDDDADNEDDDEVNVSEDDDDKNDDNADNEGDDDQDDDNEQTKSNNDDDDLIHPKLSAFDEKERQDEEDKEEEWYDDEAYDEETKGVNVEGEELDEEQINEEEEANELYMDVNVNLEGRDTKMIDAPQTNIHGTQVTEDTHVIIIVATPKAVSSIPSIVDTYLANKMNEAVKTVVQLQSDKLRDEAQAENEDFINTLDENMRKIIKTQVKEQVKEQVSKILPKIEKFINDQLEAEVLTRLSNQAKTSQDEDEEPSAGSNRGSKRRRAGKEPESTSAPKEKTSKSSGKTKEGSKSYHTSIGKSTQAEEPIHADEDLEEPAHQEFDTGFTEDQAVDETTQHPDCTLAWNEDIHESFNELMDTLLDFLVFVMNWLKVDTLTPELLAGLTYELMKGSCKSLVELEYFLEEVCKATTDQLDWNNPEGQQYPHDLCKPLPLIPNSRGRRVIPFGHFINNDLAYLSGGVSSRTYATLVTKTKAADYGHVKWIEDFVPNLMWINRESARDVYFKHRVLAVTKLKIIEWHNYKHLHWITVRRNDEKLYTFKEGDYNRLRL
ncbi:hypothetical protein Tco_1375395 [Tanacetum coccineum]